jgi:hypothetical protein
MSRILEYTKTLNSDLGYNISVEVDGIKGEIRNEDSPLISTMGSSSPAVVEAFLGGLIYAEYKHLKNKK